ncbi:hypothetical protein HQ520_10120, partial [bacterium]|nr:hypothetical protein [bacterium]
IITPILVAIFYYLIITPIGWLLRLTGRDSMQRSREGRDTFWVPLEHQTDPKRYERQF